MAQPEQNPIIAKAFDRSDRQNRSRVAGIYDLQVSLSITHMSGATSASGLHQVRLPQSNRVFRFFRHLKADFAKFLMPSPNFGLLLGSAALNLSLERLPFGYAPENVDAKPDAGIATPRYG